MCFFLCFSSFSRVQKSTANEISQEPNNVGVVYVEQGLEKSEQSLERSQLVLPAVHNENDSHSDSSSSDEEMDNFLTMSGNCLQSAVVAEQRSDVKSGQLGKSITPRERHSISSTFHYWTDEIVRLIVCCVYFLTVHIRMRWCMRRTRCTATSG